MKQQVQEARRLASKGPAETLQQPSLGNRKTNSSSVLGSDRRLSLQLYNKKPNVQKAACSGSLTRALQNCSQQKLVIDKQLSRIAELKAALDGKEAELVSQRSQFEHACQENAQQATQNAIELQLLKVANAQLSEHAADQATALTQSRDAQASMENKLTQLKQEFLEVEKQLKQVKGELEDALQQKALAERNAEDWCKALQEQTLSGQAVQTPTRSSCDAPADACPAMGSCKDMPAVVDKQREDVNTTDTFLFPTIPQEPALDAPFGSKQATRTDGNVCGPYRTPVGTMFQRGKRVDGKTSAPDSQAVFGLAPTPAVPLANQQLSMAGKPPTTPDIQDIFGSNTSPAVFMPQRQQCVTGKSHVSGDHDELSFNALLAGPATQLQPNRPIPHADYNKQDSASDDDLSDDYDDEINDFFSYQASGWPNKRGQQETANQSGTQYNAKPVSQTPFSAGTPVPAVPFKSFGGATAASSGWPALPKMPFGQPGNADVASQRKSMEGAAVLGSNKPSQEESLKETQDPQDTNATDGVNNSGNTATINEMPRLTACFPFSAPTTGSAFGTIDWSKLTSQYGNTYDEAAVYRTFSMFGQKKPQEAPAVPSIKVEEGIICDPSNISASYMSASYEELKTQEEARKRKRDAERESFINQIAQGVLIDPCTGEEMVEVPNKRQRH